MTQFSLKTDKITGETIEIPLDSIELEVFGSNLKLTATPAVDSVTVQDGKKEKEVKIEGKLVVVFESEDIKDMPKPVS